MLRDGANMLSIVLMPAIETARRAKAAYPYNVPTMVVRTPEELQPAIACALRCVHAHCPMLLVMLCS